MIISSELTGKTYDTVEACLQAEKAYKVEQKAKEEKKAELQKAYDEAIEACNKYLRLAGIEVKDIEDIEDVESDIKIEVYDIDDLVEEIINALI